MGVAVLSTTPDQQVKTRCHDCDGYGHYIVPRMGVRTEGMPVEKAMEDPERIGTVGETRHCEACDGSGWLAGFVIPV